MLLEGVLDCTWFPVNSFKELYITHRRDSARIAKSNSVLVSKKLTQEDRKNLLDIIQNARLGLQALLEVAAASDKRKEAEYRRMKIRPNMHVGIHYPQQAEEYSLPYNSNVLAGENKHR